MVVVRPGGVLSLKRRGYSSWAVVRGSRVRRAMASFMAGGLWLWAEEGGVQRRVATWVIW